MTYRRKLVPPLAVASRCRQTAASDMPLSMAFETASTAPTKLLASTATPALSTRPSFFDTLPAEIRIVIYELAYAGEKPMRINPTEPDHPGKCALNILMASKQWFNETVPIFASSTEFEFASFQALGEVVVGMPKYLRFSITSIAWHSCEKMIDGKTGRLEFGRSDLWSHRLMEVSNLGDWLPKLTCVQVHLLASPWGMSRRHGDQEETKKEIFKLYGLDGLCMLRGLDHFDITFEMPSCPSRLPSWSQYFRTAERAWEVHGDGIVDDIRAQVMQPKND